MAGVPKQGLFSSYTSGIMNSTSSDWIWARSHAGVENPLAPTTTTNPFSMGKRRAISILSVPDGVNLIGRSDANMSERSFSDPSSVSGKRLYSTASLSDLKTEDELLRKSFEIGREA